MPCRPVHCTSKDPIATIEYPLNSSVKKEDKATVSNMNDPSEPWKIKMNLIDNDFNNYYSFCPECGVDILVFSHESCCPLARA